MGSASVEVEIQLPGVGDFHGWDQPDIRPPGLMFSFVRYPNPALADKA